MSDERPTTRSGFDAWAEIGDGYWWVHFELRSGEVVWLTRTEAIEISDQLRDAWKTATTNSRADSLKKKTP